MGVFDVKTPDSKLQNTLTDTFAVRSQYTQRKFLDLNPYRGLSEKHWSEPPKLICFSNC